MTREYGDDLLDRICEDTNEDEAAKEKGMTVAEFLAAAAEHNAEMAISRTESDQ